MNFELIKYTNVSRKTFLKGIHVHYDSKRENISFRPTLKIDKKEVLGYNNFSFDIVGLFRALVLREQYILNHNDMVLKPLKTVLNKYDLEDINFILNNANESRNILLEQKFFEITTEDFKKINLEEIEKEIKRN